MPRAFTLVELIIVTGIIGLLFGLSLGGISSYQKRLNLSLAAEKLAAELSLAQDLALTSGNSHALVFKNRRDYHLERYSFSKTAVISKKSLPAGLSFTKAGKTVFAPSGFPSVGSQKSITIKERGNKTKKNIISTVGRIRIE